MNNEYNLSFCLIIRFVNYKDCQIFIFYIFFPVNTVFLGFNDVLVFFIEKKNPLMNRHLLFQS